MTSISDALGDADASSVFWLGLAIVLIIAVVGYMVSRKKIVQPSEREVGKVIHDWTPTGRIDFVGPSSDAGDAETSALFYLQFEDVRILVSPSGIEHKEIRWRKATLNEAKRVVNVFHRQMGKGADRPREAGSNTPAPFDQENSTKGEG